MGQSCRPGKASPNSVCPPVGAALLTLSTIDSCKWKPVTCPPYSASLFYSFVYLGGTFMFLSVFLCSSPTWIPQFTHLPLIGVLRSFFLLEAITNKAGRDLLVLWTSCIFIGISSFVVYHIPMSRIAGL